jgi:phosphoglycolate phosphatase
MVASASDYRDRVSDLSGVLILWDIDGTLVTHAPSARDRHAHAVSTVLGRTVDPIQAGVGKTDRQILIELFADHVPSEAEIEQAFAVIDAVTAEDMMHTPSTAITGADLVLGELGSVGATHTVLTGNTPTRARLKLQAAALANHFDFDAGFYGHLHSTRMELVADAAERLSLQPGIRPVIVGDTPLDILAAQASGIPVIAVATGGYSVQELTEHRPDAAIVDFEDDLVGRIQQVLSS